MWSQESRTFADMKELLDESEKLSSCPLPTLKYKMFSEYKQFKKSSHLRAAFTEMWKSLGFGTKSMR